MNVLALVKETPDGYCVFTTGDVIEEDGNVNSFHAENVHDFAMVIGDNYNVVSTDYNGFTIYSYYLKGDEKGGETALLAAKSSIDAYTTTVGTYPYKSFDVVETALESSRMVYKHGEEFLITLQNVMGKKDFYSALREIYSTFQFKNANTKGFLDIFQNKTDKDLTKLFHHYFK